MMPGTDVVLYNAMLNHIIAMGLENREFIAKRMNDFETVRAAVQPYTPEMAAKITGIPAATIRAAAEMYARGPEHLDALGDGLTQHTTGTDIVASLLNLMLACGMIGRWGAAMIPIRGQNNVQGSSDVGAIPFAYTDYRSVEDPEVRKTLRTPGDVPEESLSLKKGLMVTRSWRRAARSAACTSWARTRYCRTRTSPTPSTGYAASSSSRCRTSSSPRPRAGPTWCCRARPSPRRKARSSNTDRHIQLRGGAAACRARRDATWTSSSTCSNRMGLPSPYTGPADVMDELARVTPIWEACPTSGCGNPVAAVPGAGLTHPGTTFLFADRFPTADGRGKFVAVEYLPPDELPSEEYPYVLNTGRQMYTGIPAP